MSGFITCKKCFESKSIEDFPRVRKDGDKRRSVCRICQSEINRQYIICNKEKLKLKQQERYKDNRESILKATSKWAKENKDKKNIICKRYRDYNKEKVKETNIRYRDNNIEKVQEQHRKYYAKNAIKMVNKTRLRRKVIKDRTPGWLCDEDFEIMQWAYESAKEKSFKYGVMFEVDHIIPLQGSTVSGFHCPDNLTVITAHENRLKSNLFENGGDLNMDHRVVDKGFI